MRTGSERRGLACRRFLGRSRGDREFRGDPYRGCGVDCVFCDARRTHEFLGCSPRSDFGRVVFAKREAPEVLARELARKVGKGERIRLGVVSDPWQPAEREERVTRRCLEVLAERGGVRLHAETRSDLLLRDLDVLGKIAAAGEVSIGVGIATPDPFLARRLEPGAPAPGRRMEVVRRLGSAGIAAGVELSPVAPGVNDTLGALAGVAERAARAGAAWLRVRPLELPPGARETFLGWLRRERPELVRRYHARYGAGGKAPGDYAGRLAAMAEAVRAEHGLAAAPAADAPPALAGQLALPFGAARFR